MILGDTPDPQSKIKVKVKITNSLDEENVLTFEEKLNDSWN